jgi:hypothetical protein
MNTTMVQCGQFLTLATAKKALIDNPLWIIIKSQENDDNDNRKVLLKAADLATYLATYLATHNEQTSEKNIHNQSSNTIIDAPLDKASKPSEPLIDLLEIPAQRFTLSPIHSLATLYEAKKAMEKEQTDALYVIPQVQAGSTAIILGVITRQGINNHYQI